jgi:hypothetical protein
MIQLGWREWVALPELGIPAIKAKVDTGARTSALHTFDLDVYHDDSRLMARFRIHPLQRRTDVELTCTATVIDQRLIKDSGGHSEKRYVIRTMLNCAGHEWPIEITLTNRDDMSFRMLLGRTALAQAEALVDPARSYLGAPKPTSVYKAKPTA